MEPTSLRALRPTPWDVRAAGTTLALGALLFVVACLLGGATDEGGVTWATRAARTLPAAPLCTAAVTFLALRRARARGEMLALESVGCSPARAGAFVVIAAGLLGAGASLAVLEVRGGALDAFFPRVSAHADVVAVAGGFDNRARGVHIARDGELTRDPEAVRDAERTARAPRGRAASVAWVLFALGLGLPLVAARAAHGAEGRAIAGAAAMCALCIFFLQAAAAGRAPPWAACAPASLLLIAAAARYRSRAW